MTVRLAPNSFSVSERLAAIFYCNVNVKIRIISITLSSELLVKLFVFNLLSIILIILFIMVIHYNCALI